MALGSFLLVIGRRSDCRLRKRSLLIFSLGIVKRIFLLSVIITVTAGSVNREGASMMGDRLVMQESLFYQFRLDDHVPADHMLRAIDRFVDLEWLRLH
jgi:hypothetical protein